MRKDTKFYNALEKPIKETVRLLRDNGFNTTCSCGHKLWVEMEFTHQDNEVILNLKNLLTVNGYKDFKISTHWDTYLNTRSMKLQLYIKYPWRKKK